MWAECRTSEHLAGLLDAARALTHATSADIWLVDGVGSDDDQIPPLAPLHGALDKAASHVARSVCAAGGRASGAADGRAALGLPLGLRDGTVVGALVLQRPDMTFAEQEATLLAPLARAITDAVERELERVRADAAGARFDAYAAIVSEAHGRKPGEELLRRMLERVRSLVDADGACILVRDDNEPARVRATSVSGIVSAGLEDVELDTLCDTCVLAPRAGVRAGATILCPLRGHDGVVRALRLDTRRGEIDDEDVGLAELAAACIASYVEAARAPVAEAPSSRPAQHELLAVVLHELLTPLTTIFGFSELMLTHDVGADSRRRYKETIHRESERLIRLVRTLLDLERIDSAEWPAAAEPLALADTARAVVDFYRGTATHHTFEVDDRIGVSDVYGDPDGIELVLRNLVGNAIKYSPDGGRVQVLIDRAPAGRGVRVSVTDEGIGIEPQDSDLVFKRFVRLGTGHTGAIPGSGLGLAVVKGHVEAHGGRVGVDSAPHRGSTFWFELPQRAPAGDS